MSLSSILRKENNRKNVKTWFRQNFPLPKINSEKSILIKSKYYSPSLIGTAFDYLMRFEIKRINKNTFENQWNADVVIEALKKKLTDKNSLLDKEKKEEIKLLVSDYRKGLKTLDRFLSTGVPSNKLIDFTTLLARLDFKYRTKTLASFLHISEDQAIDEIKKLHEITPWNEFQTEEKCFLNPTFEKGSSLVNGADADLIIGNILIDIKTSKTLELTRSDFNQILGYYILSLIGKINGKHRSPVNKIGIYFARYGYLWACSLSDYFDEKEFNTRIVSEFTSMINDPSISFPYKKIKKRTRKKSQIKKFISPNTSRKINPSSYPEKKKKLPPSTRFDLLDDDVL
ncbi:MAG: hypothetical protein ACKOXB_08265 [Flavobacteriales bacterium]